MIKNYFKTAWRNLTKYKALSFINIFGLAVAMSVCMLMILMLSDQLSYDKFQKNRDRIYRIATTPLNQTRLRATIPFPVANTLKSDFPSVEDAVFLRRGFGGDAVYNLKYAEIKGYFSTPSFFKVFSYDLEAGNAATALEKPGSIVISHKTAEQLFGKQDAVGKTINFSDRSLNEWTDEGTKPVDWGLFTVTGVFADHGYKSHLQFDGIMSASTLNQLYAQKKIENLSDDWSNDGGTFAYVLLRKTAHEKNLKQALNQITQQHFKDSKNSQIKKSKLTFQPLTKINPGPVVNNSPTNTLPLFVYYILGGLVLVILLTSCLNYTSLSVARSVTRSGEIGLRKVIGAYRKDLIIQFLCETMLTVFLSLLLANCFLLFLKNAFLHLWINKYLKFDLHFNVYVYLAFVIFSLLISFISGIYPALKFSKALPLVMIKKSGSPHLGKWGLRRVLTVSQFAISLIFIITSIVIYNQFKYYMQFDYGFNPKNVVNINLQGSDFQLVKNAFKNVPGVKEVSGCAYLPSTGRNDGLSLQVPGKDTSLNAIDLSVDPDFINVMEIPLLYGSNISKGNDTTSGTILVNEAAAKQFGFPQPRDIVGQNYMLRGKNVRVAGVIKDFTFFLLFQGRTTGPLVLHKNPAALRYASVKLEAGDISSVMKKLTNKWKSIDPVHPMQYEFYNQALANTNKGIFDLVSVISFLAFLAVTIACLGLLGMAIYTTERRTKEIGIRKVLGASEWNLNFMLSKEFLMMLGLAIIIAAPLAFLLNNYWLNFMVVRDKLTVWTLLFGSFILLVLGLLAIVPQTFKIAKSNPVESLRSE
ncbi:MAG: ABC transporter permease [Bacteroidota bacterium]|nr:ABC transporter permease [Bacteroidota bacterium]